MESIVRIKLHSKKGAFEKTLKDGWNFRKVTGWETLRRAHGGRRKWSAYTWILKVWFGCSASTDPDPEDLVCRMYPIGKGNYWRALGIEITWSQRAVLYEIRGYVCTGLISSISRASFIVSQGRESLAWASDLRLEEWWCLSHSPLHSPVWSSQQVDRSGKLAVSSFVTL